MSYIKKLTNQTIYYGISSILGRLIFFFILPFQTRKLSLKEIGLITELYAFIAIMNLIFHLNLDIAFFKFANKNNTKKILSIIFLILILSIIFWSLIIQIFSSRIIEYMGHPKKEIYIYLALFIIILDSIIILPLAYYRQNNLVSDFIKINLSKIITLLVLNIMVLYWLEKIHSINYFSFLNDYQIFEGKDKIKYLLISNIISSFLGLILSFKIFFKIKFFFDFKLIIKVLKFSVPLALVSILSIFNDMFVRISVKYLLPKNFYHGFINEEILGFFSSCFKLSVIMNLFIQSFRYAAEPFFLSEGKNSNHEIKFIKILDHFIFWGILFWFLISINIDFISIIMLSSKVRKCVNIVPFAMLSYFFNGIYFNLSSWFKITNKTYMALFFNMISFTVSFFSIYFLMPKFGYWSSILAMNISSVCLIILCYIFGQKFKPVNYNIKKNLMIMIPFIFMYLIYNRVILSANIIYKIMLGIIISCIALFYLFRAVRNNYFLQKDH